MKKAHLLFILFSLVFQLVAAQAKAERKRMEGNVVFRYPYAFIDNRYCNAQSIDGIVFVENDFKQFHEDYFFIVDSTLLIDETKITDIYYYHHPSYECNDDVAFIISQTKELNNFEFSGTGHGYYFFDRPRMILSHGGPYFVGNYIPTTELGEYWEFMAERLNKRLQYYYLKTSFLYTPIGEVYIRVVNRKATSREDAFITIKVMANLVLTAVSRYERY